MEQYEPNTHVKYRRTTVHSFSPFQPTNQPTNGAQHPFMKEDALKHAKDPFVV